MVIKESSEERKKRFKAMTSSERKVLIRAKMQAEGLEEGSGVPNKELSSYDNDEIRELIKVTSFFPEMRTKPKVIKPKATSKNKSLIAWIIIGIVFTAGMVFFYEQNPSPNTRRELAIDSIFFD